MRKLKKQIKQEAEQVSEALMLSAKKFVSFMNIQVPKFRNPFILLKLALVFTLLFLNLSVSTSVIDTQGASAMVNRPNPEAMYLAEVRGRFEEKLITEVDTYIKKMAPTSKLEAINIVEKCLEYETDIVFVLSQGLLESHFGTKGKASQTNSVWNVGTYDDGQVLYRYKDPNESIEPYLKLLNNNYLIEITPNGDTIFKDLYHLVEDRGYTNYAGARFASARGYENAMRKLMLRIDMETSISFYQEILSLPSKEILVYFAPKEVSLPYEDFTAMN